VTAKTDAHCDGIRHHVEANEQRRLLVSINQLIPGDAPAVSVPETVLCLFVEFDFAVVANILSSLYRAWEAAIEEPVDALRRRHNFYDTFNIYQLPINYKYTF